MILQLRIMSVLLAAPVCRPLSYYVFNTSLSAFTKSVPLLVLINQSICSEDPRMPCRDEPRPLPSHERCHGLHPG